jgi:hypothetical protein
MIFFRVNGTSFLHDSKNPYMEKACGGICLHSNRYIHSFLDYSVTLGKMVYEDHRHKTWDGIFGDEAELLRGSFT